MLIQGILLACAPLHNVVPSSTATKNKKKTQKAKEKVSRNNFGVPPKKLRVIPISRPLVPREYTDSPYLLVWVALMSSKA